MKNITLAVLLITSSYVGTVSAQNVKTIKYFSTHVEEAKTLAKNCNRKEVECKNAKWVAWEASHKPKSESVKK